jgi:hypothetical protein
MRLYNTEGLYIYENTSIYDAKTLLQQAIVDNVDLHQLCLQHSDLTNMRIRSMNLSEANFDGSNLSGTVFEQCDLSKAYFGGCIAATTYFDNCDLNEASFNSTYLVGAYFPNSNLVSVDFRGAILRDVNYLTMACENLDHASRVNLKAYNNIVPEEGSFIAYKAVTCRKPEAELFTQYSIRNVVAKIEIPENAARTSNIHGRKCRASAVKVLGFYDPETRELLETVVEAKPLLRYAPDNQYFYRVGEISEPDRYDDSIFVECTHGIHFFMSFAEAADWCR